MKMKLSRMILLSLIPFAVGMGSMGMNGASDKIPLPEKSYTATIIDQMDVSTQCTDVSIEGNVSVIGKRGEGTITVSFQHISEVIFLKTGDEIKATVKTRGGEAVQLNMDRDVIVYGRTGYGTYRIKIANVKRIVLLGPNK